VHSEIACDHNDHDHYADDVKDIHCFAPIKITLGGQHPWLLLNDCKDSDLGLSKSAHRRAIIRAGRARNLPASVCAEFSFIIPYAARATGCNIVVVDLDVHPGG
jgi:hypothetical protein